MILKIVMAGSFLLAVYCLFCGDHARAAYNLGMANFVALSLLRDDIRKIGEV